MGVDQISLRGASTKEITRDALLEKVAQEREFRNYARRASASALFIQVRFYLPQVFIV
jgi:ubiquitin-protein ligase E3 B